MARPKSSKPGYCLHKSSCRAYVTIDGKTTYLGRYGSPESRDQYDRLIGEWIARGRTPDPAVAAGATAPAVLTVSDVCIAFCEYAHCLPLSPLLPRANAPRGNSATSGTRCARCGACTARRRPRSSAR